MYKYVLLPKVTWGFLTCTEKWNTFLSVEGIWDNFCIRSSLEHNWCEDVSFLSLLMSAQRGLQHFHVNQVNCVFFNPPVKDYQLIEKCGQEGSDSQTQLRQYLQHFVLISTHLLQTSMDSSYPEAVETTWVLSLALKGLYRTLKVPHTECGREIKTDVLPWAAGTWVLTEHTGELLFSLLDPFIPSL